MNKTKDILIVFFLILGIYSFTLSERKLEELKKLQTKQLIQLENLETKQLVLQRELLIKTDPEYLDLSLRAHFDKILRESPEQVRGIDGKLPKER